MGATLWGALLLCMLHGLSAQDQTPPDTCPAFPADNTIVETAAGCEHAVEIPFTMKSHVASATEIAILDTRPPGSTLEVKKQFVLLPDDDFIKVLPFKAILRWTPQLEHGGLPPWTTGGEYTILVSSTAPSCRSFAHSVIFRVSKCEYCISDKESMHSIADRFSTHWTQIWSSNHQVEVPDRLAKGQRIKLGNFYKTIKGDTWKLLAVRFGTTVERLLEINPELASEDGGLVASDDMVAMITPDSDICVMPDTCPERRIPHPGVTW